MKYLAMLVVVMACGCAHKLPILSSGDDTWIRTPSGEPCIAILKRLEVEPDRYWYYVYPPGDRVAGFNRKEDAIKWALYISPECRKMP